MAESTKTNKKKQLLIVAHQPSDNTRLMAHALLRGAQFDGGSDVHCQLKTPFNCTENDVLGCDALILFTTENFGYMSGALKDFFDRLYYPCLSQSARNDGKPFSLVVRAGLDGTGTIRGIEKITSGLKWRAVQKTLLCKGDFGSTFLQQCETLGQTMTASLDSDLI